jgi:hypothetical protein
MTAPHWSAWVGYLHYGAFAADFAERVEEEEEGLEEGVEVQAVPGSSPGGNVVCTWLGQQVV